MFGLKRVAQLQEPLIQAPDFINSRKPNLLGILSWTLFRFSFLCPIFEPFENVCSSMHKNREWVPPRHSSNFLGVGAGPGKMGPGGTQVPAGTRLEPGQENGTCNNPQRQNGTRWTGWTRSPRWMCRLVFCFLLTLLRWSRLAVAFVCSLTICFWFGSKTRRWSACGCFQDLKGAILQSHNPSTCVDCECDFFGMVKAWIETIRHVFRNSYSRTSE